MPRHWLGGDAYRTQAFNAQSLSFPLGEQYFLDSVKSALPLVNDPALREQIKGFIGQEATHRHLHTQYNDQLAKHGVYYFIEPFVRWRIKMSQRFSIKSHLAITMAYEHLTAIFADGVLGKSAWMQDAAEPLKNLWLWHAAEETEHKSVAFDTYKVVGVGYGLRMAWFAYVWMTFTCDTLVQTLHCLYRDKSLFRLSTLWSAFKFYLGRDGLIWFMGPQLLDDCRPSFHLWDKNNLAAAQAWLHQKADQYRELG